MTTLKQLTSVLLMTLVGMSVGVFAGYTLTFYAYGVGVLVGAPVGAFIGALIGRRTALRDSAILFVGCIAGTECALLLPEQFGTNTPPADYLFAILFDLIVRVAGGPIGAALLYLPARYGVPFSQRRLLAAVLVGMTVLWVLGSLIRYAYFWQPA